LLNPIDKQEVKRLPQDPAWAMQEKFDGHRVLVRKTGAEIPGINRKGLLIGLPSPIVVGRGSDHWLARCAPSRPSNAPSSR
jgi:bifunctional non-homologous end joining protein LigD